MKTASRIVGTAFFHAGFETQDSPRYGAERRGAPIAAYVRASSGAIRERGVIRRPELAVVADATLVGLPAAEVLAGLSATTTLVLLSEEDASTWQARLNTDARVLTGKPAVSSTDGGPISPLAGIRCAAIAARLVGVIDARGLRTAIEEELATLDPKRLQISIELAQEAFDAMAEHAGSVEPTKPSADRLAEPWIDFPFDPASISAPVIYATRTTEKIPTGLWRKERPVIDETRCTRCWWLCSSYCPDGAITVTDEGRPQIDYAHCKGCMVCLVQCPPHAIEAVEERA